MIIATTLLAASWVFYVQAAEPSPQERIAIAADQALHDAERLSYFGRFVRVTNPVDGGDEQTMKSEGYVQAARHTVDDGFGWKFKMRNLQSEHPQGAMVVHLYDGHSRTDLIPESKLIVRMPDCAWLGSPTADWSLWYFPKQFNTGSAADESQEHPFSSLLSRASESRPLTRKLIDGVACLGFRVVFASEQDNYTHEFDEYYFGETDGFIRSIESSFVLGNTRFHDRIELHNLVINPDLPDSTFTIDVPRGYKEKIVTRPVAVSPSSPDRLVVGAVAPDFALKGTDGREYRLSELKGKVVVLDFFGTWCGPCNAALPGLERMHEENAEKAFLLAGLSCKERKGVDVGRFMQQRKCTYTVLLEADDVASIYAVEAYPTVYVIDKDGRVAYTHTGSSSELHDALEAKVHELLAGS